jgi:maltose alpha-D-glucosyltransferase / alpha-amylase
LPSQLALAHVRRERRVGLLTDGFAVPAFAHQIVALLAQGACRASPDGEIRFEPTPDTVQSLHLPADAEINWLSAEQSNSSLIIGDAVMLKIFRRIAGGPHPEAEMGRYLTQNGFANAPPLLGEIARVGPDGTRFSLAMAQGFVHNQGDAWSWLLDQLLRALDDLTAPALAGDAEAGLMSDYEVLAARIGQRLGDLHVVLARPSDDPAFAPATATAQDIACWREHTQARLKAAFGVIAERKKWDRPDDEARAVELQKSRRALLAALHDLAQAGAGSLTSRIHGDFHLGQVLVVSGDVYIIDFEGEPARPLAERRAKSSPLRDVAGILRSFDYAAATIIDRKNVGSAPISDERRDEFIARFRACAPKAFLEAYRTAISASGATMSKRLLDLFLLEKAAYEVTYEAANRPSWFAVPLAGLSELARRVLQGKRGGEHGGR